ncbi:MAG: hypothetical protein GC171_12510 [Terrimonas sp.]|nr:hypothetical protein [Terrimonas sp.]
MAPLLFKWLSIAVFTLLHPFYVSVIEVNHNASDKTLEISCKIFTEDFEEILEKNNKTKVDLSDANRHDQNRQLVRDYIFSHLSLKTDGITDTLQFIGFEKEREAVWVYLQVNGITRFKSLEMNNSILHDFINSQINIMHVTEGGVRKSTKLDYPNTKAVFTF